MMVLLKIDKVVLENFISHRKTEITFDHGVTAIIGNNGAGKTSIIDAVIVAFGGRDELKIRGSSQKLIRTGASEARVSIEFSVGNRSYVVERIISRMRGDYTRVLYEIVGDGKKRIIARGSSVSEELRKIIGLDPSVMNTIAILRQGRLNELLSLLVSNRRKARQELIDELLGIDKYRRAYENMVKVMEIPLMLPNGSRTMFSPTRKDVSSLRSLIEDYLRRRKELENNVKEHEDRLKKIRERVEEIRVRLEDIREKLEELHELDKNMSEQIKEYEHVKKEYDDLVNELELLNDEIREIESRVKEEAIELKKYRRYYELADLVMELDKNIPTIENLRREYEKVKEIHDLLMERIDMEKQGIIEKISRYKEIKDRISKLEGRREELENSIEELKRKIKVKYSRKEELEKEVSEIKIEIGEDDSKSLEKLKDDLIKEISSLNARIDDLRRKIDELRKAGAKCPLCGRDLTKEHRDNMINKFSVLINELSSQRSKLKKKLDLVVERLKNVRELEKKLTARESMIKTLSGELKELENTLSTMEIELEKLSNELGRLREELRRFEEGDIEDQENRYRFLLEKTKGYGEKDLDKLEEQLKSIEDRIRRIESRNKDIVEKLAVKMNLSEEYIVNNIDRLKKEFMDGRRRYEKLLNEYSRLEGILVSKKKLVEEKRRKLESLKDKLDKYNLDKLYKEKEYVENELRKYNDLEKRVNEELIKWSREESALKEILSRERDELERVREFLDKAIDTYRLLALAYYIRENILNYEKAPAEIRRYAIKALEKEASSILEQFDLEYTAISLTSDLSVQVYSSSGNVYGLPELSGGEQVAVVLAIVLGLHKLIGRGRLGILALDEPTIHLDEERRKKLIEIIKNFRGGHIIPQLIVITHNREVVDASDQVYEVVWKPSGSEVKPLGGTIATT